MPTTLVMSLLNYESRKIYHFIHRMEKQHQFFLTSTTLQAIFPLGDMRVLLKVIILQAVSICPLSKANPV